MSDSTGAESQLRNLDEEKILEKLANWEGAGCRGRPGATIDDVAVPGGECLFFFFRFFFFLFSLPFNGKTRPMVA